MLPKVLISLTIFIIIITSVIFVYPRFVGNEPTSFINPVKFGTSLAPSPTPFPFAELTIPYLREREYQSRLGELEKFGENINYTSYLTSYDSDGLRINGLLTKPKGEQPVEGWPAIIFIHGYIVPSQYRTTQNYAQYVDYFAKEGFVVFKIDLRGHDKSEGEGGGAYYSSDYIIDALNAYSALGSSGFVDPEGIGLWGHSMAGNVVFRSLAAESDIPAVVIWAGAVYTYEDFSQFRISDNSYSPPSQTSERRRIRQELFDTHGEFNPESEFWKLVPATNYLDEVKGAVQIHHAVDDNVVNIGYSRNLMKILDKTLILHEFYEYSSGGHNLTGASFNQAMERSVEFFRKYLSKSEE
ncbi:MAG: alpha/beta hydrolase [Candidatus Daviesbacteria bacterium]|nr:alpha/beta hydrolase [Candidatus Daviesbacteria bacterium]